MRLTANHIGLYSRALLYCSGGPTDLAIPPRPLAMALSGLYPALISKHAVGSDTCNSPTDHPHDLQYDIGPRPVFSCTPRSALSNHLRYATVVMNTSLPPTSLGMLKHSGRHRRGAQRVGEISVVVKTTGRNLRGWQNVGAEFKG